MLTRNPGCDQLRGDSIFRTIVLNPHFAVADVYVQDNPVNAVDAVPAVVDQFVMIVLSLIERRKDRGFVRG